MYNSIIHKLRNHHFTVETTYSFKNGKWIENETLKENQLIASDFPNEQVFSAYCACVARLQQDMYKAYFVMASRRSVPFSKLRFAASDIAHVYLNTRPEFKFENDEILYLIRCCTRMYRDAHSYESTKHMVGLSTFRREFEYTVHCRLLGIECIPSTPKQEARAEKMTALVNAENLAEVLGSKQPLKYLCSPVEEKVVFPDNPPKVPSASLIVSLKFSDDRYGDKHAAAIISDESKQSPRSGILWIGHMLSATILTKIRLSPKPSFQYNGMVYHIYDIQYGERYDETFNTTTEFCSEDAPQTIHVFAQKNLIKLSRDDYECVTAMIPYSKRTIPVPVTVIYEKSTHRYFISDAIYCILRGKYGLPYLRLRTDKRPSGNLDFSELKPHSELFLLGYSVDMNEDMGSSARQDLLCKIIDSGILTKYEIMNHLEWLIHTRSGMLNMENALFKWASDLEFVSGYQMDKQRSIWVDSFSSLYSGVVKLNL